VVRRIDPNLPLYQLMPMSELVSESAAAPRFRTLLLAIFAGVALTLALVGVYGVTAYFVSQRAQEIGIRIALGATRRDVVALVVGRSARLAAAGLAIGLVGAGVLTSALETLLFEVRATDPGSYAAAGALLGIAAVAASAFPAWRAARVDATIALRAE
jgi:putative ABC transport system permease protein